jgi:hypothetical protein
MKLLGTSEPKSGKSIPFGKENKKASGVFLGFEAASLTSVFDNRDVVLDC